MEAVPLMKFLMEESRSPEEQQWQWPQTPRWAEMPENQGRSQLRSLLVLLSLQQANRHRLPLATFSLLPSADAGALEGPL